MEPFEYHRAADAEEALSLVAEAPHSTTLLAGGTDVVPLLKDGVVQPRQLVDIKRLNDVNDTIRITPEGVVIGALTTLSELADHEGLAERYALLGQAARAAATPQLRSQATVAGNLLQRPRCWYFRNPAFHCWLAGGDDCPARHGRNERHAIFHTTRSNLCCAVHPSDLAPCLVALDAEVLVRNGAGEEHLVPVEGLFRAPTPDWRQETVLERELIVEIRLPAMPDGTRTGFDKAMDRQSWSFALSAAAVRLEARQGRIADARIVLGGVAGVPWRAHAAEAALRDQPVSEERLEDAARQATSAAHPLEHNAYKLPLTRALVARTLRTLVH